MSNTPEVTVSIPSQLRWVGLAGRLATVLAAECGGPGADELAAGLIELAVNEATVNAVKHGSRDHDQPVRVRFAIGPGQLTIRVEDHGPGFALETVQGPEPEALAEHGYGLVLIQKLMDRVEYRRESDINVLEMTKEFRQSRGGGASGDRGHARE